MAAEGGAAVRSASVAGLGLPRRRGRFAALAGLYGTYYAALGALAPFLALFYRAHGMSGVEIGVLAAVSPTLALLAQPLWAGLADRRGQRRGALCTVLAGAGAAAPLFLLARGFVSLLLAAAAMAVFTTSIAPLADSLTLVHLGGTRERYARVRLWGAAGFSLAAAAMGAALLRRGLGTIFVVYPTAIALALLAAWAAPAGAAPPARHGRPWAAIPELWRAADYRAFVGIACLLQLANSANNAFLSVYLHALGSSTWVVGLAWSVAAACEVPVMALAPRLAAWLGPRRLLALALVLYAARYAAFGLAADRGVPWVLGLQLVQGVAFGLFYTTAVPYVSRLAPPHLQTSAQGVYAAATQGATAIVGTVLAGVVFDRFGPRALYGGAAGAAALSALALTLSGLPLAPARGAAAPVGGRPAGL
jgi:PPP family 3-phenylpropionic acid transporter